MFMSSAAAASSGSPAHVPSFFISEQYMYVAKEDQPSGATALSGDMPKMRSAALSSRKATIRERSEAAVEPSSRLRASAWKRQFPSRGQSSRDGAMRHHKEATPAGPPRMLFRVFLAALSGDDVFCDANWPL